MADKNNNNSSWRSIALHVLVGCTAVSEGCRHCWAALTSWKLARCPTGKAHVGLTRFHKLNGPMFVGKILFREERLKELAKLVNMMIWVAPMSDLFHPSVTLAQLAKIYAAFYRYPNNKYQILTKRVERMLKLYTDGTLQAAIEKELGHAIQWPPPNTWEGTSVEDQKTADYRIPILLSIPSNYRFVSIQPLLGPVNLMPYLETKEIHYAVLGNEAGPLSRPFNPNDVVQIQSQLRQAKVPHLTECFPL